MRIHPVIGGWHCDALPDGSFVVLVPNQHVLTHLGPIAFKTPERQPLFPRLAESGPFRFAGQSWGTAETLEYDGAWQLHPAPCGVSPVIYDNAGTLRISDCSIGSQGYRYNDPTQVNPITGDATYGPSVKAPKLYEWTDLGRNGDVLVVGQGDQGGVVLWDGATHRWVAQGSCRFVRAHRSGDQISIAFYRELGGASTESELVWASVAELLALPPVPDPVPVKPIGPTSDPLSEGTEIDLAPFISAYDPAVWPRGGNRTDGDEHAIDMQPVTHKGEPCFWHAVFGHDGKGRLGSLVQIKDGCLHLLADCHNRDNVHHPDGPFIDTWSDTRWLPLKMRIGRQYGWTAPDHTIRKHRDDGTIFNEFRWFKEQWIHKVWPRFWCGPDLGERMVVQFAQNNTGIRPGQTTTEPGLGMESDYLVLGAGRCRWTYDRAMDVFVGPNHAPIFPAVPLAQSDFWHVGGPRYTPVIPSWIPLASEVTPAMKIPLSVQTTMQAFAGRFPLPLGGDDVAMHDWSRRMAEQIQFSHGNGSAEWGLKSTSPGSPTSNNITLRDSAGIHTWDYIVGSAGPSPSLNIAGAEYFFIPNQHFISVQPIDHLGTPVPPSKFPPLALPFWGASAFDLAARVSAPVNDWRYYEELKRRRLKPRIQCYATITHPATGRLYRDFGTGLAQLRVLLPKMAADGMQGQFVYLVGTTPDGVSRSEAINRIRQLDALVCSFPSVVAGRQGGNELYYPGLEEPYLSEDGFWREVEAILDPRFPWTRGAGHGGAGVNMSGGSYFVHHSNRDLTPDQAGEILGAAQRLGRGNVVDDEPRRLEAGGSGQATGDLNFVRGLIANAKRHGYGLTLHNAAGRGCSVDFLDDVQRQALDLIAAEVGPGPSPGHPIFDAPLRPALPVGYHFFTDNGDAILREADAWYRRSKGHAPARKDVFHGVWRAFGDGWWNTLREAWEDGWPGGAP